MDNFLEIFLITVAIAIVLNVIFKKFEIPTIIGYIAAGEIISEIYLSFKWQRRNHSYSRIWYSVFNVYHRA